MRSPAISGLSIVLLTLVLGVHPAKSEPNPAGIWLTQAGDARVQVSRCGGGICGRIVWLRDPIDANTGQPQLDDKNPNPALARRPMIGLFIFSNMQAVGTGKWTGRIYNADDGQTYAANITLQSDSTLEVQGCVGALCGGETWTRLTASLSSAPVVKRRPANPAQ